MFNGLTNIGKEYIAKCLAENKPITFTKVKIGDGLLDLDENAELLTDVKSLKKEVEILDKTQEGELTTLTILLDNSDIEVGYYPREIGIYVTDEGVEKLYWYINDELETQWLCAANKYPIKFKQIINLMTTNLESVIVNWSGKDLFVDREFVEEKIKEKVRTFEIPTIAELQSRKNLKVGDIVEVLGYYTAGDGAGHKRIIANEDDGSGVQLANKLWANILHNGEVNVSWFGAKGDGIDDDTNAFQKCDGLRIYIPKGKYLISNLKYGKNTVLIGEGIHKTILQQKENSVGDFITLENWSGGRLTDFTINGSKNNVLKNYMQSLIKIRNDKNNKEKLFTYHSYVNNIAIVNSKYSGISILGYGETDDGVTCNWNWIYHINSIWIENCKEYGIYNSSTDNLLSNINISNCGYANIYERGSSNMWTNMKLDGMSGELKSNETVEQLMNDRTRGALLIVRSDGITSFTNLDCQSSGYTGVKLIQCKAIKLQGSINNCGTKASQEDAINFCPALYLYDVQDCNIDFLFAKNTYQYRSVVSNEYVLNNKFKFIIEKNVYLESKTHELYKDIYMLKKDNIVEISSIIDYATSIQIKLKNLLEYGDLETDNKYIASKIESINPIFGTKSAKFSPSSTTEHLIFNNNIKGYKKHIYLCLSVFRTDVLPTKESSTKYPYLNIIEMTTSSTPSKFISNNPIFDKKREIKIGNKYLVYDFFTWDSEKVKDNFDIQTRFYSTNTDGTTVVDNICIYDLTQDLGITTMPVRYFEAMYLLSELLVKSKYDKCNVSFSDIDIDYSPLSFKKFVNRGSNITQAGTSNLVGEMFFDTSVNKPLFWTGEKWVDSTGAEYSQVSQLNTIYHLEKMKQENVYDDYISYMDEKTAYDKQQKKLEQDRQLSYEEALKENPNLTYEEFRSVQPMTLNLIEEPQPSEALKKFMEKYL